jgi:hypothetical protein
MTGFCLVLGPRPTVSSHHTVHGQPPRCPHLPCALIVNAQGRLQGKSRDADPQDRSAQDSEGISAEATSKYDAAHQARRRTEEELLQCPLVAAGIT